MQEWRPSRRCLITGRVYEHWNDCNQGCSGSRIVVCDAVKQRSRGITTTALAAAAVLSLTTVPPAGSTSEENLDNCNTTQKNKHSMFTLHLEMSAKGARSTYWNIMRHKECTNHTAQTIGTVWGLLFVRCFSELCSYRVLIRPWSVRCCLLCLPLEGNRTTQVFFHCGTSWLILRAENSQEAFFFHLALSTSPLCGRTPQRRHQFRSPCNHCATVLTVMSPRQAAKCKNHNKENKKRGKKKDKYHKLTPQ